VGVAPSGHAADDGAIEEGGYGTTNRSRKQLVAADLAAPQCVVEGRRTPPRPALDDVPFRASIRCAPSDGRSNVRVDTQVHVISRDQKRYPLDPPSMDVPRWFELYGRTAEELLGEMDAVGMDRVVLVQGFSAYQYDNRYTANSAETYPDEFACACIVDIHADPLELVQYWVGERHARAIRFFLQLDGDVDWLDSRAGDDVFVELHRQGAIAQAALVAEQLPALQRAAARHRCLGSGVRRPPCDVGIGSHRA